MYFLLHCKVESTTRFQDSRPDCACLLGYNSASNLRPKQECILVYGEPIGWISQDSFIYAYVRGREENALLLHVWLRLQKEYKYLVKSGTLHLLPFFLNSLLHATMWGRMHRASAITFFCLDSGPLLCAFPPISTPFLFTIAIAGFVLFEVRRPSICPCTTSRKIAISSPKDPFRGSMVGNSLIKKGTLALVRHS